tara:strand:- start:182 stop:2080 length:1899 start_codon:yes stop_codon:yes gene_type:complete
MKYRPEIDGLRALAVIPVILFHAGLSMFSGGFLGVDVFFVISGYLITTIILYKKEHGKFSLINFYERRARRILPALFFVLLVVSILAYIIMSPSQLKDFGQSIISTISFSSNIYFWLKTDYWAQSSNITPLIHIWSLGIEEQFYIFFPLLLIFTKKNFLKIIFYILLVLSFLGMLYLHTIGDISKAFYLLPFRAWELVVGAIAAVAAIPKNKLLNSTKVWINFFSLLALIVSYTLFDKHTFPAILYGVPVIATFLIIIFPAHRGVTSNILKNSYIVYVGLISYSLYLFHQPFLALMRITNFGPLNTTQTIVSLLATLIMSVVSYKFIETPFRNHNFFPRKSIFLLSFLLTILFLMLGGIFHYTNGLRDLKISQMTPETKDLFTRYELGAKDRIEIFDKIKNNEKSNFDTSNKLNILFLGDSTSRDLLAASLLSKDITEKAQPAQFELDDECIKNLASNSNEINTDSIPCKKKIDIFLNSFLFKESQAIVISEVWVDNAKYLDYFLRLPGVNKKKIIVYLPHHFSDMRSLIVYKDKSRVNINSTEFKKFVYINRNQRTLKSNKILRDIANRYSLSIIKGFDFFCNFDLEECSVIDNAGFPLMIDQIHLSGPGFSKFSPWFAYQLKKALYFENN